MNYRKEKIDSLCVAICILFLFLFGDGMVGKLHLTVAVLF